MRGVFAAALLAMCATSAIGQLDVDLTQLANDPRFNKMLPLPKIDEEKATAAAANETQHAKPIIAIAKPVVHDHHHRRLAAAAAAAAADHKKASEIADIQHSEIGKHAAAAAASIKKNLLHDGGHSDEYEDDYDYSTLYDNDDDEDDDSDASNDNDDGDLADDVVEVKKNKVETTVKATTESSETTTEKKKVAAKKEHTVKDLWKLKPIKGDDQNTLEDEKPTKPSAKSTKPDLIDGTPDGTDADDGDNDDSDSDDEYADEDDEYNYDNDDDLDGDNHDINVNHLVAKHSNEATTATSTPTKPHKTAPSTSTNSNKRKHQSPLPSLSSTRCPMNCVCELNLSGFLVANCDRLDPETMHFSEAITDLEVLNVPPKFPLLFGADFFQRIGLGHINSIKIVDSTIESVHPDAFRGLDQLYYVNLTNTGLDMLPPDAFAGCTKLRILTLAGNDLHAMQQKNSPFVDYMLNVPNVEELYLNRCNIKELLPTAFGKLPNIVFISLAENMLTTLPHNIFHSLATLEELDLSSNSIENLPRHIFDNTSLSILNMRYNEMSGRPAFVAPELQKLDLSYNKLTTINDMMFTDMPNLNNLVLKGNAIRKVHHAAFAPLADLRHVDVSFNDLEQVSSLLFLENAYLETVRLNDNSRLKRLPMEGFESASKEFNVYLMDVSNCDLSELGEKTFQTMPKLTILNLSWNNIESLGVGVFVYLTKLTKLDLSNNLINELSDMLLLHNRNLKKLNLAGNPLEKLSSKVFLPTKQLTELDISDCDLKSIWAETEWATNQPKNLLKNLRTLNVSNNAIAQIRVNQLVAFDRLTVLDVSNNQLACDKEFRDVMKWLQKKKIAAGNLRGYLRETVDDIALTNSAPNTSPWEEYINVQCKKSNAAKKPLPKKTPPAKPTKQRDDEYRYTIDDGALEPIDDNENDDDVIDTINDKAQENDDSEYDDDIVDGDDDAEEGGDEEDDGEEEDDKVHVVKQKKKAEKEIRLVNDVRDFGIKVESDVKSANKRDKLVAAIAADKEEYDNDDEDDDDDDDDDEDADTDDAANFETTLRVTYMQYGYLMPMLLVLLSVLAFMAAIAKIVSVMMHRRGERYRQALLASKNSIVYQKLSEEIGAPATPKFHRYAPIEQV